MYCVIDMHLYLQHYMTNYILIIEKYLSELIMKSSLIHKGNISIQKKLLKKEDVSKNKERKMASSDSETDDLQQLQRRFVDCIFLLTKQSNICKYKDVRKMIDDHLTRFERLSERVDVIQDEDKVNQFLDKSN